MPLCLAAIIKYPSAQLNTDEFNVLRCMCTSLHVNSQISLCVCVCSGFSGSGQPGRGFPGAGAPARGACDGCGGSDPRPDGSVREAGRGEVCPGQHPPLCRHVSQLAAQCL